jgi:hypothetical protein
MGCDIHLDMELRGVDGQWHALPRRIERQGNFVQAVDWWEGRNYPLFAILADVRNAGFSPIAYPRGMAPDASSDHRARVDRYDIDGHSHSWHTLRQLLDFNWNQAGPSEQSYGEWAGGSFIGLMLRMWRWSEGRPDDVRIVFFFDN